MSKCYYPISDDESKKINKKAKAYLAYTKTNQFKIDLDKKFPFKKKNNE